MEPAVLVQAREADYAVVEAAIKEAAVLYASQTSLPAPQITIDKQIPLPANRCACKSIPNPSIYLFVFY